MAKPPLLLCIACFLIYSLNFSNSDKGRNCSKTNASLLNYESQFEMVQHQLRGVFRIIDNCSFNVTEFDMLKGSDVHWWGALGYGFTNLTHGFVISDHKLNGTYKNDSFVVHLLNNVSWDQIKVVSIWDKPTASNFGHVVLRNGSEDFPPSPAPSPSPSPSPSPLPMPTNGTINASLWIHKKPTMFDNCKTLSKTFRVRWTLRRDDNLIDIGLEAATSIQNYMAFGWANSSSSSKFMLGADVAVTGFTEKGMPFIDDYYITKKSECMINKDGTVQGVCPDTMYNSSDPDGLANNTWLAYGHRKDGVSFIRYQRPLKSIDKLYDLPVNRSANMTVIWAMGSMKPPDTLRPFYLPQNHGGTYGHLKLNVSEHVNDCLGPLDAKDKEDQDVIIADKNDSILVSTGPPLHYPNPPNPSKVFYINKKEAPVLRVERGVPVKFSIQAGHDVAFYVTSDPLGGNVTMRNGTETVYVGGPKAEGVQSRPTELVWAPDRNTPDEVYYQSLYTQKMGWKVQVVEGGLPDMYNNSVVLDDQQVTLFWTLSEKSISIAARGEKKSGYLAIGFGSGMVNSYTYVGWIDANGTGRVNTYWIDGKESSNIHPTKENLTYVRCKKETGVITLEFTRPLNPSCDPQEKPECNNIIEPTTPLKVIWAMGARWAQEHLSEKNMHFITSKKPVRVLLMRGSAEAVEDLQPVLAVHGFMMFLAWGILLPSGVLSARYLKHVKGDKWFQIHVYLQYSGLAIIFLGFLFAVAELRGFYFGSLHVKFGTTAIILACLQPVNAYLRPKRPANGEDASSKTLMWEYIHVFIGRSAIFVGVVALVSGMKHLGDRYDGENVRGLSWALIIWFLIGALTVLYLENREKKRRREGIFGRGNWVLGEEDENLDLLSPSRTLAENLDLLSPSRTLAEKRPHPSERMEIQLEPLNR